MPISGLTVVAIAIGLPRFDDDASTVIPTS